MEPEISCGDFVKCFSEGSKYFGEIGEVASRNNVWAMVKFGEVSLCFSLSVLIKVHGARAQNRLIALNCQIQGVVVRLFDINIMVRKGNQIIITDYDLKQQVFSFCCKHKCKKKYKAIKKLKDKL